VCVVCRKDRTDLVSDSSVAAPFVCIKAKHYDIRLNVVKQL